MDIASKLICFHATESIPWFHDFLPKLDGTLGALWYKQQTKGSTDEPTYRQTNGLTDEHNFGFKHFHAMITISFNSFMILTLFFTKIDRGNLVCYRPSSRPTNGPTIGPTDR